MARPYQRTKLTPEQQEDVAMLLNAGVRYCVIARTYGAGMDWVHMASQYRTRFIDEKSIARTFEQKFWYAQRTYRITQNKDDAHICALIEREILKPIAQDAARATILYTPGETLLMDILGRNPFRTRTTRDDLERAALNELTANIAHGRIYQNPSVAVERIAEHVVQHARRNPRETAERYHAFIDLQLEQMLGVLPVVDQKMVKLSYGVGYPHYNYVEIGKAFRMKKQAVHLRVTSAVRALRPLVRRHLPQCGAPWHKKKAY